jgi:hypothetical protein
MKALRGFAGATLALLLCVMLLGARGALAQEGDQAATPVAETPTAVVTEAPTEVPVETATSEPTSVATETPDDGLDPASIGEEPGGNVVEENGKLKLISDMANATPYAFVNIPIPSGTSFAELSYIGAVIEYEADDNCAGGSPRFSIDIDTDGDGSANGQINIYVGSPPNFDSCTSGDTGNLLATTDTRFDLSQLGGAFYATYADALAAFDEDAVVGLGFYVDGGWKFGNGEQTVLVDSLTGIVSAVHGLANIEIRKVSSTDHEVLIPGACFIVREEGGAAPGDPLSAETCDDDNDGIVDILGLPAGEPAWIIETVAPDGYIAGDAVHTDLPEGDSFYEIANELAPTATPTQTATATATATATTEPTVAPPAPTSTPVSTSTITTLPSTGTGQASGMSGVTWVMAALLAMISAFGVAIALRRRTP